VSRIQAVLSASDYDFVFVTLTVPNVDGSELSEEIDKMQAAWNRFIGYSRIKKAFLGYFKSLEVTRNNDIKSKNYGTYHPHYHIIFVVHKRYFRELDYIKRDELLELWKRAKRDDRITQVDIRRVTDKQKQKEIIVDGVKQKVDFTELGSAVAEIAKYAVKSSDFLGKMDKNGRIVVPLPDWLTDEIVSVYSIALAGRRLCAFGGVFEQVRKELNLDDPEDGDLIHEDGEQLNADLAVMVARYGWSCGAYKLIEIVPKTNVNKNSVIVECED
jgi:plasmid rolling circle replication initiator protein Rep